MILRHLYLLFIAFFIVSGLTKQLYQNFESIHKINRKTDFSIFFNITFILTLISNLYIIYNLNVKILFVTHLHFIKD